MYRPWLPQSILLVFAAVGWFASRIVTAAEPPVALEPAAALKTIQVRPGFKVELMAAEPLVLDPIAFEFGPDGRLWVVEMGDYPLGPSGGQIRLLEDTNGDSRYDKATVFLEVRYPTGVLPWGNGVLITAAPNVLYAEDTDGDGKADKQQVLYSGFVEGNPQHRVNGFARGLDNWLYIANGDSGGTIESHVPGPHLGKKVNISGRDLRIRPETGELDAVAGQTQFGRCRDDWGNWFGCNNSNPMYQFVLDDAYQRRNPYFSGATGRVDVPEVAGNAPVFPISPLLERFNDYHTANRFTSACSVMVYRDELLGPQFAGNAFICEPVHNLINRQIVSANGLLFSSKRAPDEQQSEFLASSDNWFRPTTVKVGPDGALWIADMYRHVIEHPQWIPDTWQKKLDLRAGHDKGRLYRVYPTDKTPRAFRRLDKLDTADLVAALDSSGGWQRDTVQQLLVARNDKSAVPSLESQAHNSRNALCRLHSLATLAGLAALAENVVIKALNDEHPGVRRHAVGLVESLPESRSPELFNAVLKLKADRDPHVRLQVAYALGEFNDAAAALAIGEMLVADGNDRFLFSALMSSVKKSNVEGVLMTVLAASRESNLNQNLIINLLDLAAALGNDKALVRSLESVTQDHDGAVEVWQFAALARLLDSLARRNESLFEKIKKTNDARTGELLAGVDRLFAAARKVASGDEAEIDTRRAAVRLLGRGRDQQEADLELLDRLLAPQVSAELQRESIAALGRLRQPQVPEIIVKHWRGFVPARRTQALDTLMSRDAWAAELMTAVAAERILPADFDAARRQRLHEHRSLTVRQQAAAVFTSRADTDRQKVVDRHQSALALAGKADRGAQIFAKMCAQCHKLAGVGHEVGPDLTSLTDKSAEALLVAVLDPNRAVENKFLTFVVETKSGMTLSGILDSETGNSLMLLGPERKEQVILRSDIEELVSTSKSMMPEGLEKDLLPQDLADLIAYIRSHVPLPRRREFDGNEPRTVTPAANGALVLEAAACEIYGSLLIFEPQHKNLGFWSALDDHAIWNIEVKKPGTYSVEFDWACDGSVAGNRWQLTAPGAMLVGRVESTGGWNNYRRAPVGEITLKAGKQQIVMRPTEKPQGALIDLKSIKFQYVSPP